MPQALNTSRHSAANFFLLKQFIPRNTLASFTNVNHLRVLGSPNPVQSFGRGDCSGAAKQRCCQLEHSAQSGKTFGALKPWSGSNPDHDAESGSKNSIRMPTAQSGFKSSRRFVQTNTCALRFLPLLQWISIRDVARSCIRLVTKEITETNRRSTMEWNISKVGQHV